jgi:hypothetical protein
MAGAKQLAAATVGAYFQNSKKRIHLFGCSCEPHYLLHQHSSDGFWFNGF